ncbi:MAG: tetratricopeptide repeat protein, partial [Prevotellaceae bacterium]|nr:tetratricopeptide repeat protein [Prevotellaceae bacterium]
EKLSDVKRMVHYHHYIDELNGQGIFPKPLCITNMEAPLTQEQVDFHFELIDEHTSDIVQDERDAKKRFLRGMDFYLVQDFDSSIDDFTQSILLDDTFFPAYFMRALVRCKELEYKKAESTLNDVTESGSNTQETHPVEVTAMDYEMVESDLNRVVELAPDFVYGYYNRGNVYSMLKDYRAALADYDKAIELNPEFVEAYFNRGLTNIFLGNNKQGIADLSKAGEQGIYSAYNIIKRFANAGE